MVVEIAVASDPEKVRVQKASKYKDLQNNGVIPDGTRSGIQCLAELTPGGGGMRTRHKSRQKRIGFVPTLNL